MNSIAICYLCVDSTLMTLIRWNLQGSFLFSNQSKHKTTTRDKETAGALLPVMLQTLSQSQHQSHHGHHRSTVSRGTQFLEEQPISVEKEKYTMVILNMLLNFFPNIFSWDLDLAFDYYKGYRFAHTSFINRNWIQGSLGSKDILFGDSAWSIIY